MSQNDASPVATTTEFRTRRDMHNAPLGKKLIAINPGGVAVFAVLSRSNLNDFIEWCPMPKRALPEDQDDDEPMDCGCDE